MKTEPALKKEAPATVNTLMEEKRGNAMIIWMIKLFDTTFFRFFFGFIGLLFLSLAILLATKYWHEHRQPNNEEMSQSIAQGQEIETVE